jgi:hypothetical protein
MKRIVNISICKRSVKDHRGYSWLSFIGSDDNRFDNLALAQKPYSRG